MVWDEDNEIWEPRGKRVHRSGHRRYYPDRINWVYNRGEQGDYWPEHEDYDKGKKGYIIEWGTAQKNDLTHKFCSNVDESSINSALASSAVKRNLDKFDPTA